MLLGSEIGAALTALEPLGIDLIGLNCATGPAEMSEHLRHAVAARPDRRCRCMPNAGLPQLTRDGARYPLTPEQLADAHDRFTREFGLRPGRRVLRHDAGAPAPRWSRPWAAAGSPHDGYAERSLGVASLYQHVTFRQDTSYLVIGERTNANGSKAFRDAMLERAMGRRASRSRVTQIRDGAHLLDLCIDYVGRDGVADMREVGRPVWRRRRPCR